MDGTLVGGGFLQQAADVEAYGQFEGRRFLLLAQEWHAVAESLSATDLGILGEPTNANVVRLVRLLDGTTAVLKASIAGGRNEAKMLSTYQEAGACCVRLSSSGTTPTGRPWILTEYAPYGEPSDPLSASRIAAAARLGRTLRQATTGHCTDSGSADWPDLRAEVLSDCVAQRTLLLDLLASHEVGADILDGTLVRLAGGTTTLLHGDMRSRNTLDTPAGLMAIDPRGMLGPPEAEIATWIWIAAAQAAQMPSAAVQASVAVDPELKAQTLRAWVAIGMLLLAAKESASNFLGIPGSVVAAAAVPLMQR